MESEPERGRVRRKYCPQRRSRRGDYMDAIINREVAVVFSATSASSC
jgi:hypothetical protein